MDISTLSMDMSMLSLQNAVSVAVMQKAINQDELSLNYIVDSINDIKPSSAEPSFNILDIKA